ncbi:MAG: hypothetical protein A3C55_04895 [Gammaproteobacteria bacterium RIFCSPHIGHO2_02_FULL_42_13]|nr:MAG: hypothetical protein A3C55_04895 [Gammaproteobacteria bacterium RIFCSPHIGHO2_02_FULL_42_13]OGT70987.1 MAG: hypothetical protein A3H43_03005 [Gammaproteobacteria bacterium RIFCSPLOWO2_02_FULL_42_9]
MLIPVILAGGIGERLRPLSTPKRPKQFLPLFSDKSLLQETMNRIAQYPAMSSPMVIGSLSHRALLDEQLMGAQATIILEPVGRNTAPAIAIAALRAMENGQDPILFVLPSDHLIQNQDIFYKAIAIACAHAEKNKLVTFGIVPHAPETGYGYIQTGERCEDAYVIKRFVEKPPQQLAEQYLAQGGYYWNSGMFLFRASIVLHAIEMHAPDIYKICREALKNSRREASHIYLDETLFAACKKESIDYAVMEKTTDAVIVPLDAGWSDVGSWHVLWSLMRKNHNGYVKLAALFSRNIMRRLKKELQ